MKWEGYWIIFSQRGEAAAAWLGVEGRPMHQQLLRQIVKFVNIEADDAT